MTVKSITNCKRVRIGKNGAQGLATVVVRPVRFRLCWAPRRLSFCRSEPAPLGACKQILYIESRARFLPQQDVSIQQQRHSTTAATTPTT